jgi:hypothetical protein
MPLALDAGLKTGTPKLSIPGKKPLTRPAQKFLPADSAWQVFLHHHAQ